MYGTTVAPLDKKDPVRTRITKMLCKVCDPEEKRRIIGDVFMEVSEVFVSSRK
jgi:GMP synthase PP-ATPase subunit